MKSLISLGINKMEIDWGKHSELINHSKLFQEKDYLNKIPYYTVNDDKEIINYGLGAKKNYMKLKKD